jgi:hypothetical protein
MTLTAVKNIEALLHDLFEEEADACQQQTQGQTFLAEHPFVEGLIHIPGCLSKCQQV